MSKTNHKPVFISWTAYNPHSSLLNDAFNGQIFYVKNLINTRGILWKLFFFLDYFYKCIKTISIIKKNKPDIVIVQNPPSIVPILAVLLSYLKKYKLVVDSHNGAFEKPWSSIPIYKWSLRKANIVIVHNYEIYRRLKSDVKYGEINFRILNSRLSEFKDIKKDESIDTPYILVVSTFASDEPMDILLEGLRLYNRNNTGKLKFKLTGNYNKKKLLYDTYKDDPNIEFLGFVSNLEYKKLILNALGIISLSSRDDVQQFALMESIGAGIPFISNNNITNRSLFGDKMVLFEINPQNISEGIEFFMKNKNKFEQNILTLKTNILTKWEKDLALIKSNLNI